MVNEKLCYRVCMNRGVHDLTGLFRFLVSSDRSIPISDSKAMNIVTGGRAYTACDMMLDGLSMILNRMDRDVSTYSSNDNITFFNHVNPIKYIYLTLISSYQCSGTIGIGYHG